MTSLIALAHPALAAAAKSTTKSSSGSSLFLVFLIVIAVAGYFLFLRPQQQKARKQRQLHSDIQEGDEVVTVGGVVGRVLKMDGDRVHLLTGYHSTPDLDDHLPHRMTFVRNAVSRKLEPPAEDAASDDDFDFEHAEDADTAYAGNGHAEVSEADHDGSANGRAENGRAENGRVEDTAAGTDGTTTPLGDDGSTGKGRGRRPQGGTREGTAP